ncbi:hypothetical protein [Chondrinema litorale]|uniref:hypothetical protein n=1 Tax=Chondrinema litorale TaxID=2994555 RepID=UPI002542BF76|nr:hypothetical protein [Chondrinema litorale]UZR98265.1 hypothetical protein OQ292_31010 [Chondrinema litorale]
MYLKSEDTETRQKQNIPLASTNAIDNILDSYIKHVNCFLYLAKYHEKYRHLNKELSIEHVDEDIDLFLDEVENFSIDTPERKMENETENNSIKFHLSKIIMFLSKLLKDHYEFWDSEMVQVIHEHIIKFKYLSNYFQRKQID